MEGGFGISSIGSLGDAAKSVAGNKVAGLVQSDAAQGLLNKAEGAAGAVGLGAQFSQLKDSALKGLENLTGVSLSSPTECPPDRIDTPTVSRVLVSTAENPCKPNGFVNSLIGYVVVDSRNPSDYDKKNKNTLWYTSIGISALLIGLGVLYGQIDK
jgi:hypothetical protein